MHKLDEIMVPGWRICYRTFLEDKLLITSWLSYEGCTGSTFHKFGSWQQTEALPQIGIPAQVRIETRLTTDAWFRPVRYQLGFPAPRLVLKFTREHFVALLYDGTRIAKRLTPIDFLLPSNMLPNLAVAVRLRQNVNNLGRMSLTYFAPETLESLEYTIERSRDTWVSNYREQLKLDNDGWLTEIANTEQNIKVRLAHLALPRWRKSAKERPSVPSTIHKKLPSMEKEKSRSFNIFLRAANQRVGATLTLPPRGQRSDAVVVFLSGSGTHDRDGRSGEIDLGYRKLLEGLAIRGIASIRHDKPGAGGTKLSKDVLNPRFEALLKIGQSALNFVRKNRETSRVPLYLVGHSQGGLIALKLAYKTPHKIGGVVLLATAGRPLDLVIGSQIRDQASILGLSAQTLKAQLKANREFFWHVRNTRKWTRDSVPPLLYARRSQLQWYRSILDNPTALIVGLGCRLLILQGDRDLQVSVRDAEILKRAAVSARVPVELLILKSHNHLLRKVPDSTGMESYSDRRRQISNKVVQTIADWIKKGSVA